MTYLDPQQFIITRKRKKYRFAKFHNATNCYEYDEWCQAASEVRQSATVLEVGAGTGMFSVELAAQHPDEVFVALDVKGDRLQKGAYRCSAAVPKHISCWQRPHRASISRMPCTRSRGSVSM